MTEFWANTVAYVSYERILKMVALHSLHIYKQKYSFFAWDVLAFSISIAAYSSQNSQDAIALKLNAILRNYNLIM
jgi:hypothetical protein